VEGPAKATYLREKVRNKFRSIASAHTKNLKARALTVVDAQVAIAIISSHGAGQNGVG
jgi:hypothetical protein